jgi:hypothetical protein
MASARASNMLTLSGPQNRDPFPLWLTLREEEKPAFRAFRSILRSYQ